jgi:hypothetical protein
MSFPLASRESFMFCVSRESSGPICPEISPVRMTCTQCDSKILGNSAAAAHSDEPACTLEAICSMIPPSFLLCVCAPDSWIASISGIPA